MAEIRLAGVKKTYLKQQVIHGVDATIADGEFIVIVGPSGCGKSTLLRMIAGLETITEGEVAIAGRRVNDVEPKDRNIAMVFQNYALYPHMSVYENMSYGLRIRRLPPERIRERVERAAKILELTPFLARKPRELSGGQRQRVAMGRAIVVGMRPEHLSAGEGPGPVFRFKVETVEALGADSMVHGPFGGGTLVARVDGHRTPALGTALAFTAMPGKLYFFDSATGKRLR